jgi:hypothetical protein
LTLKFGGGEERFSTPRSSLRGKFFVKHPNRIDRRTKLRMKFVLWNLV